MKALVIAVLVACGSTRPTPVTTPPRAPSPADAMVALLPDGAQVIVEIDLARLRANAVVGETAKQWLASLGAETRLPALPLSVVGSPLATADEVVMAAYGVGTAQAITITLVLTKTEIPNGARLSPDVVALGPEDWIGQLATRQALADQHPLAIPTALQKLRDHAMPTGATGAIVRVTARLSFDARVALARMTNLDAAPAELSLWCDVADDLAIVVDANASDPGAKNDKQAARRLAHTIRGVLGSLAEAEPIKALGIPNSLADARLVAEGSWVRTIVDVGPRHLARVTERARAMLAAP